MAMRSLVLAASAVATLATAVPAQVVRYGVMGDSVRAELRGAWTDDSTQSERAYCVRRARIAARPVLDGAVDTIIRVIEVVPAKVRAADPNHVDFECAHGTPELHTHTPETCITDDPHFCTAGGPGAYSCQPSRQDYEKLVRRGDEYAIIQCDRQTFRFYYPSEFLPSHEAARPSGDAAKP